MTEPLPALADLDVTVSPEKAEEAKKTKFDDLVGTSLLHLRVAREAKRLLAEEDANSHPVPDGITLDEFLDEDMPGPAYRVDDVLPAGGRVILSAQYKAGKTTIVGNLVRVLADGGWFLNKFGAEAQYEGTVVVLDTELPRRTLQTWLRDQDVQHPERVTIWSLRGRTAGFNIVSDSIREQWVKRLQAVNAKFVMLDPLNPVLSACGIDENDNYGVGRFLNAFDELLASAGVAEAVVTHHMGHSSERSRGASRLRDWPDAEWRLVRAVPEGEEGTQPEADAPRFFSAVGRDVAVKESKLEYDQVTRQLKLVGGNRGQYKGAKHLPEVLAWLRDNPGANGSMIEIAFKGHPEASIGAVRAAIKTGLYRQQIHTRKGEKNATLHYADCTCDHPTDCQFDDTAS